MKNSPPLVDSSLEGLERTFDEESQTYSGERPPIQRSRLWNAAVGMMEKRRAYPSDRARKEYLDYYAGLYQDRGPNPAHFQEMLRRNGRPFMANPFPEGTREHYLYHPEGLVLADLEAILGNQVQDWKVTKEPSGEPEEHAKWPTIDEAITAQEGRLLEVEREWALLGGVCWGMLLIYPGSLDWLKERVHADNLAWATVHALNTAPWRGWGVRRAKVLTRALEHNLFSEKVANRLFSWRSA